MKKVSKIFLTIFSIGVLITLFAGALSLAGYIVALIIGGETAATLCSFIYTQYFPWVIKICSIAVGFGLIGMYFDKKKALVVNVTDTQEED